MNKSILTFSLLNSHSIYGGKPVLPLQIPGQTSPFLLDVIRPFNRLVNSYYFSANSPDVSRVWLYEDYCTTNDSINYDCFSKCRSGGAFETMFDLSNCATVSMLLNPGAPDEYHRKISYTVLDPQNVSVVDRNNRPTGKYIVTPDVFSLCNDTVASIWKCLSTECESHPGCSWWLPNLRADIYPSKLRDENSLFDALCGSVGHQLNSDIGGIGVYVSYCMQIGLALIFFFVSMIMGLISVYFKRWGTRSRKQGNIRVRAQEQVSFLNKAIVDFHQSQCFFTIAINVAAMIVERNDRTNSESVQLLFSNCYFLTNIAISGYLPITFTLFNLYLVDKTYWYTVFISVASIVVAGFAQGSLQCHSISAEQSKRLDGLFVNGNLQDCGFKRPWVYCDWPWTYLQDDPQVVGFRMISFCAVVVAIVVQSKFNIRAKWESWIVSCLERVKMMVGRSQDHVDLLRGSARYSGKASLRRPTAKSNTLDDHEAHPRNLFDRLRWQVAHVSWPEFVLGTTAFCLYMTIVGIFCWYISIYIKNLRSFATTRVLDRTWGFGQITSLLVWAPSVSKYLLSVSRGRKRSSTKTSQVNRTFEETQRQSSLNADEDRLDHLPLPTPASHPWAR